ncbi:hypothetical protein QYE76_046725 [Lolium multiflorum]|uniref:Integrase zinc-binding domain-containing protein n=1 Tax=Lolium multiflorum TaxID=4521 RepID=A0AAD8WYM3_LOLMU|nr:hypothetical protein QYE76_046725 [Lolium multiflorum]
MLKEIHQGECGHHASSRALVAKVFRHGFYWPTALENAEDLVRRCNGCQRGSSIGLWSFWGRVASFRERISGTFIFLFFLILTRSSLTLKKEGMKVRATCLDQADKCPILQPTPVLFSVVLVSEILMKYSREWTKSTPKVLFFHEARKSKESSGATGWGHSGAARPKPGPRRPGVWPHRDSPTLPFRLFKASVTKTLTSSTKPEKKTFRAAAMREAKITEDGSLFRHAAGTGSAPGRGFSIDTTAIFINADCCLP